MSGYRECTRGRWAIARRAACDVSAVKNALRSAAYRCHGARHEPNRRLPAARGARDRRRALHVRHPGRPQHRDLRRARRLREHHAGAGRARGRRRVHGRRREPLGHQPRHAGDRAGSGRHARRERHCRGLPRRHPDAGDRGRHPPRHGPPLPAARRGPARDAEAHHQGHVARRAARRRDPHDLRGGAGGDQRRARARVRRDPGQPAADRGRARLGARLRRTRRARGALHGGGCRAGRAPARRRAAAGAVRRLGRRRRDPRGRGTRGSARRAGDHDPAGAECVPGEPPAPRGLLRGPRRRASGRERPARLRLPARRGQPLRRDRHRQLRLRAARGPDPRGHQPGRVRRQLPGARRARGRRVGGARAAAAGAARGGPGRVAPYGGRGADREGQGGLPGRVVRARLEGAREPGTVLHGAARPPAKATRPWWWTTATTPSSRRS